MKFITGIFKGVKVEPNKDEKKDPKVFLGISNDKPGGFSDEEVIERIKVPYKDFKNGQLADALALKGKMVVVQYWISKNEFNGKTYVDLMLEGTPKEFFGFVGEQKEIKPAPVAAVK